MFNCYRIVRLSLEDLWIPNLNCLLKI